MRLMEMTKSRMPDPGLWKLGVSVKGSPTTLSITELMMLLMGGLGIVSIGALAATALVIFSDLAPGIGQYLVGVHGRTESAAGRWLVSQLGHFVVLLPGFGAAYLAVMAIGGVLLETARTLRRPPPAEEGLC